MKLGRLASTLAVLPVLLSVAPSFGITEEGTTRRIALIIGSHEGNKDQERLVYAGSDAAAFRRTLEELGGLKKGDATLLVDPDSLRLLHALDDLEARVRALKREGDRVEALVYYSGHANEKGLLLGSQAFDYRTFRSRMNALGADVRIAVVDACESGALTRIKGGHTAPAFLVDRSTRSEGYAILTSSSESESAQESDRVGGSFFTNALNSGLRGAADASRDGKVTLHEAYQFAYNETLARTEASRGGPQHAGYDIQLNGSGDVVLTDVRQASSFLDLSEELSGRLFIRDSGGVLAAELEKPAGRDMRIGLSPGTYEVRRLRNGAWSVATAELVKEKPTLLQPSSFKGVTDEAVAVKQGVPDSGPTSQADSTGFHYVTKNAPEGLSTAIFYDEVQTDWRGTQIAFLATDAHENMKGAQFALALNLTRGDLQGAQFAVGVNAVAGSLHGFQFADANVVGGDVKGFQLGSLFNATKGHVSGLQMSSLLNAAGGGLRGLELSGLVSVSGVNTHGGQLAGLLNVTVDSLAGFQGAGLANLVGKSSRGLMLAGLLNGTGGPLQGGQVAGLLNVTRDTVKGAQVAGLTNVGVKDVRGLQLAGLVNYADALHGVQVAGLVNVTGKVHGHQIGVINLSDDYESGFPFGLINISRKGRFEVESWAEETGLVFTGIRTGAGWMHSQLALGFKPRGEQRMLAPTLGLSGEYAFEGTPMFWENGLLYSTLFSLDKYPLKNIQIESDWVRVRSGLGIRPLSVLTIVGGLSYNMNLHPYTDEPITGTNYRYFKTYGNEVSFWPGAWAGVRIGR